MRARLLLSLSLVLWASAYLLSVPMLALLEWAERLEDAASRE